LREILVKRPKKITEEDLTPFIDKERRKLIINLSSLDEKPGEKILQAIRKFLGQKPLEADFEKTEFAKLIPANKLDRALKTATWEDFSPDDYNGGRSVILRLREPLIHNGMTYDSIKLKGVVYKAVLQPTPKRFTTPLEDLHGSHEIEIPDVDDKGRIIFHKQLNPQGGLEAKIASNEIELMQKALERDLTLDIPLGAGTYKDLTMEAENLGFVISLVPTKKVREISDILEEAKTEGRKVVDGKRAVTEPIEAIKMRERIDEVFYELGKRLREAHDRDIFLAFPHWGNIYAVNGVYYWRDFSEAQDIKGMQETDPARAVGFRFVDIAQAIGHFDQLEGFYKDGELQELWRKDIQIAPWVHFLKGYFHDGPGVFDKVLTPTLMKDLTKVFDKFNNREKVKIAVEKNSLVQGLHIIVAGKTGEYSKPMNIIVYPYVIENSPVGQTVWNMIKSDEFPHEKALLKAGVLKINFMETAGEAKAWREPGKGSVYIEIPYSFSSESARKFIDESLKRFAGDEKGKSPEGSLIDALETIEDKLQNLLIMQTNKKKDPPPGSYYYVFKVLLKSDGPLTIEAIAERLPESRSPTTIAEDTRWLGQNHFGIITYDAKTHKYELTQAGRAHGQAILDALYPIGATRDATILTRVQDEIAHHLAMARPAEEQGRRTSPSDTFPQTSLKEQPTLDDIGALFTEALEAVNSDKPLLVQLYGSCVYTETNGIPSWSSVDDMDMILYTPNLVNGFRLISQFLDQLVRLAPQKGLKVTREERISRILRRRQFSYYLELNGKQYKLNMFPYRFFYLNKLYEAQPHYNPFNRYYGNRRGMTEFRRRISGITIKSINETLELHYRELILDKSLNLRDARDLKCFKCLVELFYALGEQELRDKALETFVILRDAEDNYTVRTLYDILAKRIVFEGCIRKMKERASELDRENRDRHRLGKSPGAGKAKPEGSSTAKDTSGPGPEAVSPDRGNDDEEKGAHLF
ncbi:MAG: hypothetical protein HQ579_05225, partial [Candidatus Omnitrophica bacterium]|nr:hypothetical protein [Candidatus Omnitrophota bacterium]